MIETFLLLLTGHLLGDFVFQTDRVLKDKTTRRGIARHVAIVIIVTAACLAPLSPSIAAPLSIIAITHFAMDDIKIRRLGDKLWAFTLDQAVHVAVLAGLAIVWPAMAQQSLWGQLPSDVQAYVYAGMVLICGVTLGVSAGGVVIKKLVDPLSPLNAEKDAAAPEQAKAVVVEPAGPGAIVGMKNAGRYIGWLERGLTIIFILINHPEGVGLLLAAKSILRFRDVQDQKDRHQAEYIIIGTFLSFGWAVLIGLATKGALAHWLPV